MQDIGNKLEAKMDNSQETMSKEIQDIKLKMQNTITETKNASEAANSRIQEAEEQMSEVEDRLMEIMDVGQKREKRLKTNEESLKELWDNIKCMNICIIRCQRRREREGDRKKTQTADSQKFPKCGKGTTHSNSGSATSTI